MHVRGRTTRVASRYAPRYEGTCYVTPVIPCRMRGCERIRHGMNSSADPIGVCLISVVSAALGCLHY